MPDPCRVSERIEEAYPFPPLFWIAKRRSFDPYGTPLDELEVLATAKFGTGN